MALSVKGCTNTIKDIAFTLYKQSKRYLRGHCFLINSLKLIFMSMKP